VIINVRYSAGFVDRSDMLVDYFLVQLDSWLSIWLVVVVVVVVLLCKLGICHFVIDVITANGVISDSACLHFNNSTCS
jgi:hypothetical protein